MVKPPSDTTDLVGGPLIRYGGKGKNAHLLVPHFARARVYAEPFFGAGSIFFKLPVGTYERESVNDLDASLVTFFRVLRDRPADLIRACELTPCARDEFAAALEHSDDELEEARRVWVRSRQGFAGQAKTVGDWGRCPGESAEWTPAKVSRKLAELTRYADRLRGVSIDSIDGVEFVAKWGGPGTFVYCDPPYVAESRKGTSYVHEMDTEHHRRLGTALHAAVARGAKVAISGYPSALYDELFGSWRRAVFDVALHGTRDAGAQRRTETLWMSYPATDELSYDGQLSLGAVSR